MRERAVEKPPRTQALKSALALLTLAFLTPAAFGQEQPVRVAYFYRVRWGFQQDFEKLFFKNHYPLLLAQKNQGTRIKDLEVYRPTFHGEGRGDWTFLVVITFTDWAALGAPSGEEALARKLFPDQDGYRKEAQRRFEILDAHWDVPLTGVTPPK